MNRYFFGYILALVISLCTLVSGNVQAAADSTKPTATLLTTTDVPLNGPIRIQFSEFIFDSANTITTIPGALTSTPPTTEGTVQIVDPSGNLVAGEIAFFASTNQAIFIPSAPFAAGATYSLSITATPADTSGNTLDAIGPIPFVTTTTAADTTAPTATLMTATNVGLSGPIDILFDESMQVATITTGPNGSIQVMDSSNNLVGGTIVYDPTTNRASFTPSASFAASAPYTVNITTDPKDLAGNNLAAFAPTGFITTTNMWNVTAGVVGTGVVSPISKTVANNGSVTYTITPGSNSILSTIAVNGTPVAAPVLTNNPDGTISWTTALPIIASTNIIFTFVSADLTLDVSSGQNGTISPSGSVGVAYDGSKSFDITPSAGYTLASILLDDVAQPIPVPVLGVYHYTLSNIRASHTIAVSFTNDTIKPIATFASATTNVGFNDPVVIQFNEAMQSSTITTGVGGTIMVKNSLGNVVAGSIAFDNTTNKASFTPTAQFSASAVYTVTITTDPKDIAGNNLTAFVPVNFTTTTNMWNVTASVVGTGVVSPASKTVANNGSVTYTISPGNSNFVLSTIAVNGTLVVAPVLTINGDGTTSWTTATPITASTNIIFTFVSADLVLDVSSGQGGTISPSGSVGVAYNGSKSFDISPAAGYTLASILLDDVAQAIPVPVLGVYHYTLSNIRASHTIAVSFVNDTIKPIATFASATTNVGFTDPVVIKFNEAMQSSTITTGVGGTIMVKDALGNLVAGSIALDNATNKASFTPSAPFAASATYTVTITTDPKDLAGNSLTAFVPVNFTTTTNMWNVTASVVGTGVVSPVSKTVANNGSVTYTITPGSGSVLSTIAVNGTPVAAPVLTNNPDGTISWTTATPIIASTNINFTFVSADLTLSVSSGQGGTISPSGSVGVAYDGSKSFTITPAAGYTLATILLDGVAQALPASVLGVYTYTLSNIRASHTIAVSFANDTIKPIAAFVSATTNVGFNDPVVIRFNEAMQSSTITTGVGGTIMVKDALGNLVAGSIVLDNATNKASFTPSAPFTASATYTVTITTDPQDLAGNNLTAFVPVNFTTTTNMWNVTASVVGTGAVSPESKTVANNGSATYTITPGSGSVLSTIAVNGTPVAAPVLTNNPDGTISWTTATPIIASTNIIFTFVSADLTLDVSSGQGGTISPSGSVGVAYNGSKSFTITPAAGYTLVTVLLDDTSTVDGLVDNGDGTWTYTLDNLTANHTINTTFSIDVTPPTVKAISPTDGSTALAQNASITATFSKSMDPATITASTFFVKDQSGNAILGTVTYSGLVATFTPSLPLPWDTQFTAYITTGAKDLYDNSLAAAKIWSFKTRPGVYAVTLTTGSNGTTTSDSADLANVADGSNVIFTITPVTGYHVANVLLDGTSVLSQVSGTSYTLNNVMAAHTVNVSFAINTYTLTTTIAGSNGTLTASSSTADYGSNPFITITPAVGYILESVTDSFAGSMSSASPPASLVKGTQNSNGTFTWTYTISAISQNRTITATFRKLTFVVTPPASGTGTVTPGGTLSIAYGGSASFDIVPANGYILNSIIYNNAAVTSLPSLSGGKYVYSVPSVTTDSFMEVSFKLVPYIISMTTDGNGTITSDAQIDTNGKTFVNHNGSATFTINSKPGYSLATLTVDGVSVVPVLTGQVKDATTGRYQYTYTYEKRNITSAISVNATFVNKFTITASSGINGTISPSGISVANANADLTYSMTPASDQYQVASIKVDGQAVAVANSYTFSNLNADHTIEVTFGTKQFTVTAASSVTNGTVSLSSSTAQYGGSVDAVITPDSGYKVIDISLKASGGSDTSVLAKATQTASGAFQYTLSQIKDNYVITPVFDKRTYQITTSAGTGGAITATSVVPVYNASVIFTITPESGFNLLDVTVDGISVKSQMIGNQYTLNTITSDHTVAATFANIVYTLTSSVNNSSLGSIAPSGTTRVNSGANQNYQITVAAGAVLDSLLIDGVNTQVVGGAFSINNITRDHTIVANFKTSGSVVYPDGDINHDGKLDISDVLLALNMSVGMVVPTAADLSHGDVGPMNNQNKPAPDGKIDINDVVVLLQRVVGNIPAW